MIISDATKFLSDVDVNWVFTGRELQKYKLVLSEETIGKLEKKIGAVDE
jgi:hypothetical protein